jgi:transposase
MICPVELANEVSAFGGVGLVPFVEAHGALLGDRRGGAMKVHEVIMRAMSGEIAWFQAAEIIGISCRQMQRWKRRWENHGYEGLLDRRRGQPSPKRIAVPVLQEVLRLYREQYFDFNVRHFHTLEEQHNIKLSYTWVKTALQMAGLVKRARKRGKHRKRRERRPLPGMMLHIDGSHHSW